MIQSVLHASRVLYNPDISEAVEFRNRIGDMDVVVHQQINVMVHGNNNSLKDNFMCLYPKKSVHVLILTTEDGFCIIMGTVKEILKDEKWLYPACSCNRAVNAEYGVYYCDICFCLVFNVTPRYLIKVKVKDKSEAVVLVLFDWNSQYLLRKSCVSMVNEIQKEIGSYTKYIAAFVVLVGKKVCNLGDDDQKLDSVFDKDYVSQVVDLDECVESLGESSCVKMTHAKQILVDDFDDGIGVKDCVELKVVKLEDD